MTANEIDRQRESSRFPKVKWNTWVKIPEFNFVENVLIYHENMTFREKACFQIFFFQKKIRIPFALDTTPLNTIEKIRALLNQ